MHYKGQIMFKKIAVLTTLAILASSAIARDDTRGKYAGFDVGQGEIDSSAKGATSAGAFLGYRFNRAFAIEGALHRLGNFEFDRGPSGAVNKFSFGVIGTVSLSDRVGVYGRAGVYAMNGDRGAASSAFVGKEKSAGLTLGAGVVYAFTPTVSGRVEVQNAVSAGGSDWTHASAGMVFRF